MKEMNDSIFLPQVQAAKVQTPEEALQARVGEAARIADETIELFPQLAEAMMGLCKRLEGGFAAPESAMDFMRLIDGLQALAEAVQAVRLVKKVGDDRRIQFLEADLVSTLKDLLSAREGNHFEFMREIIVGDLQENLRGWMTDGYNAIKAAPYR